MDVHYQVLQIFQRPGVTIALLSQANASDCRLAQALQDDFDRLADDALTLLVLDVRQCESMDGAVLHHVVKLAKTLHLRAIGLRVCVSQGVHEALRVAHLDRLMEIAQGCDELDKGNQGITGRPSELEASPG